MVAPYDISGTAQNEVYDANNILTGFLNEDGNILSPYDDTYFIGASIDGIGNILDLCGNIVPLAPTVNRGGDIKWMDTYRSNRHIQTYYNGFVDISGGDLYLRENSNMYLNQGDISLNGMLATPEIVIHDNSITCKNKTLNIVPANRGNHNNTGTVKVKGNMTIDGSLNFIGDYIITNTNVTVTEQVDISNDGTGPALIARQMGDETVVEFYDDAAKVFEILDGGNTEIHRTLVVHDTSHGSDPSFNCRVGIGTQPEYKLDVHGVGFIRDNMHINTNDTAPSFIPSTKGQLNVGISQIGYVTFDDVAMFSHKSQIPDNTSDPVNLGYGYALAQKRIGETILNAATNEFINFSIENDQKMLLDTSGTLTIGHNTTQYTDANGIERHIPLDYVKLDVNGNARITGHTFIGGSVDISGSNVDLNGGKLYIGSGNSFLNQGRITRDELPVGNEDPLVFGSDQFSFSLLEYANPTTNRTQASVASFEGNLDVYGLTFVNGTHIQDNLVINNGDPFIIENTEVNTINAPGEPTFKLVQDYDDLNKTDNDFIHCIARDFAGAVGLGSELVAPPAGTDAPVKAFVLDICGNLAIRTNKPSISLDISGEDAIRIPAGANADRPENPKEGYIRFNNETNVFEGYREIFNVSNGLMQPFWDTVTTLQDVDQDTKILAQDYPGADNDELKFFTSGSERMRIYADGKVGIGTTRPEVPLHIFYTADSIEKDLSANIGLILENDGPDSGGADNDSVMQIKSKGVGESMIIFNNNNTDLWGIQSGNGYDGQTIPGEIVNNKNFSIVDLENFQTNDNLDVRVGKNPRFSIAKATGNIGIGTMSPAVKLDIKGVGMVDTANSPAGCDVFLDNVPLDFTGSEFNYRGATLIFDGAHGLRGPNKIRLNLTAQYGTGVSGNQVNYFTMDDHVWYYCRKRAGNDLNDPRIPSTDTRASFGYDAYNTEEDAKIGMELRQEALTVYNDISGNNEGKIAYSFYAAHKLDYTSYLGTAAIGYGGPQPNDVTDNYTGAATFAYWNFNDNKSIHGQDIKKTALRHLVTGETILNATINQGSVAETALRIRTQDTDAIRIGSDQRIGINTSDTKGHFHIHEETGRVGNGTNGGTLTLSHGDQSGTSSIIFKNKLSDNTGLNDYAYIRYKDSYLNSFAGNGSLEIGSLSNINENQRDSLILQKEGGYVGIGTAFPHHPCHLEGPVPFNFNGVNSNSVFYDDLTQLPNVDVEDSSLNVVHIRGRCVESASTSNKGIFGPILKVESTAFPTSGPQNKNSILVGIEVNTKPTSSDHIKVENNMAARFLGGRVSIGLPNAQESIEVSGNILATESLIANSDERIKTNIEPITNALEKVEAIRGVYFNKINSNDKKHIGVIGQEIEQVFPELVETYTENQGFKDFKGVKYANLVAPLIEAIKELSQQNKLLNERISTLENKFS